MERYFNKLPPGERPPPPKRSSKPDIRQYLAKPGGQKKQRAQREWVQDDDPVERLQEQADENKERVHDGDVDQQLDHHEVEHEWGPPREPEPPRFADQRTKDAEYAVSALDADQRAVVPHGWVDTTRAGKSEVIAAAQAQAPHYGVDIVPGEYGHKLTARRTFIEGGWIAPYRGVRMRDEDVKYLPNNYDKIVPTSDGKWNIVGDIQNPKYPSIGAYADDPGMEWNEAVDGLAGDPKKIKGNARFVERSDGTMWLRADEDIKPGQDVTVNYGEEYWLSDGYDTALAYFKNPRYIQKRSDAIDKKSNRKQQRAGRSDN